MSLIEIKDLRKVFEVEDERIVALNRINLKIEEGEICCVLGTSGSGKSTLLNILAGLEKPTLGSVYIDGVDICKLNEKELALFRQNNLGFVFQSYNLMTTMTAMENVAMPLMFKGVSKRKRNKKAVRMLKAVKLGNRLNHRPSQMSGGQQQRVGIARAFVSHPKIVFADEPTGNLDSHTTQEVMEIMINMARKHHETLMIVTHDRDIARYADRIIFLLDGNIKSDEKNESIIKGLTIDSEEEKEGKSMKKRKLLALLLAVSCAGSIGNEIGVKASFEPWDDGSGNKSCPAYSEPTSEEADFKCSCIGGYEEVFVGDGKTACTREQEVIEPDTPDTPTGKSYIVQSGTEIPVLTAGDSLELNVPLEKNDFRASSEVQITATLPEGMYFYEVSDVQDIKFPGGKEKKADLPLKISIDSEMKSGVYPIKLSIDYKYDGGKQNQELDYYVKVEGSTSENGSLVVSNYKVDKENIKAGDTFNLRVTLANKTNKTYKDIKVGIDNLASEGISPYNAMGSVSVPELKSKASTVVNFSLIASKDIANANQKLDLVITAQGLDEAVHESAFVYVNKNMDGEGEDLVSKPKIVINSYDYGGENVVGGTPFTLTISFMNTSSQVSINNLKMTIQSATDDAGAGGVFTPTSSSDSFFVKSISPNGVVSESIELMPRMDATPKSYGINVTFDYEAIIDGEIVTMNSEEKIAIPVVQSDRFDIGEVEIYGPMYVGQESYVNLSYVNKGKTTINNLEIKVEGENFTSSENNVYVGNVDSGSSDYYSFNLMPMQVGEVKGAFIFTYEDANGSTVEVRKEFSSDAIEMDMGFEEPIEPMIPEEVPEEGLPMWGKVVIGIIVVAGIGAAAFFVIKKKGKANKKIETYDDDDDEE